MGVVNRKLSWHVIGRAVCGALHRRSGAPLQDAISWTRANSGNASMVLALADGHGWPLCFRSQVGAQLAVETVILLLQEFHHRHPSYENSDLQQLAQEEIPGELVNRWRQAVTRHMAASPFAAGELEGLAQKLGSSSQHTLEADPLLAYGSTVLGVLATSSFALFLQLGDGDLLIVSRSGETKRPWPRDSRLLGVETTSLCMPKAWNEVRLGVQKVSKESPELLLLCTDGYSNSFRDEEGFLNVGRDFLEILRSEGIEKVNESLEQWLTETTESGSGDDVSVGLLWRNDEGTEKPDKSESQLTEEHGNAEH